MAKTTVRRTTARDPELANLLETAALFPGAGDSGGDALDAGGLSDNGVEDGEGEVA